jgi:hypothetical protein
MALFRSLRPIATRKPVMVKRRSFTDLRRPKAIRQPRLRFLIACEGRRTEPYYFLALSREFRNPLVYLEIEREGGTPKTLVERAAAKKKLAARDARSQRDPFLAFDQVWCVFDVDEHPYLADALQQARANGIKVAVSNPCFELWVLLHFQEQSAFLDRAMARRLLKKYIPGYQKIVPFEALKPYYNNAVERAKILDARCESAGVRGDNPSTGVYRLTEGIREGSLQSEL